MPISEYVANLRSHVGNSLLMLPSVSAVVVNERGELLLGQRSDNSRWSLIAGAIDPGEQPADAVVREVYEEAGIHVAVERLAGAALHPVVYPNGDECQYLNLWFHCRAIGGTARVNDDESLAVGWFSRGALPPVDEWVRLRIDETLDGDSAWFARPGTAHPALGLLDA
ncbi:NUDIX hydrolase [Catellatospora tritici]|uniref:NUDIX hydrolase n=1 Tax=Catellatospora tritici TaxID=2851566 RepID=UPI001C2D9C1C|nr:NUDIX domain-containing protein [Catellatospora tritici]MBV1854758.1 NUDIX domain-containing protein [Catellatospora tritici]